MTSRRWVVERRTGTAGALHGPWPAESARDERIVAVCSVAGSPALVLGSSQRTPAIDEEEAARIGLVVVKRSSGGGAVLVAPGEQVWVDVWIPHDDPLWDDDIVSSSAWLGVAWGEALRSNAVDEITVHDGRMHATEWSDVVCFAGTGPGEVAWRGRKLVGLSQRRTRHGARFHTTCPLGPAGESVVPVLGLDASEKKTLKAFLLAYSTCLRDADPAGPQGSVDRTAETVVEVVAGVR